MSKKSTRKSTKKAAPRPLDQINREYQQAAFNLGQLQYNKYVLDQDIEKLNKRIMLLNQEGAARKELDKQSQTAAPAPQVPTSTPPTPLASPTLEAQPTPQGAQ